MAAPSDCPAGLFYLETPFDSAESWIDYAPPSFNSTFISGGDLLPTLDGQPGYAQVLTLPARPIGAEQVIITGNFSVKFAAYNFSNAEGGFRFSTFNGVSGDVWDYIWQTKLFGGDGSGFYFRRLTSGAEVDLLHYPSQGPFPIELKIVCEVGLTRVYLNGGLIDTLVGHTFWGNTAGVPLFIKVGREVAHGCLYSCSDFSIVGPDLPNACPLPGPPPGFIWEVEVDGVPTLYYFGNAWTLPEIEVFLTEEWGGLPGYSTAFIDPVVTIDVYYAALTAALAARGIII